MLNNSVKALEAVSTAKNYGKLPELSVTFWEARNTEM